MRTRATRCGLKGTVLGGQGHLWALPLPPQRAHPQPVPHPCPVTTGHSPPPKGAWQPVLWAAGVGAWFEVGGGGPQTCQRSRSTKPPCVPGARKGTCSPYLEVASGRKGFVGQEDRRPGAQAFWERGTGPTPSPGGESPLASWLSWGKWGEVSGVSRGRGALGADCPGRVGRCGVRRGGVHTRASARVSVFSSCTGQRSPQAPGPWQEGRGQAQSRCAI